MELDSRMEMNWVLDFHLELHSRMEVYWVLDSKMDYHLAFELSLEKSMGMH